MLEDRGFDLKLVNAKHVKMVPGCKTDLAGAAWLAELLEHGLLRSSLSTRANAKAPKHAKPRSRASHGPVDTAPLGPRRTELITDLSRPRRSAGRRSGFLLADHSPTSPSGRHQP